jgi:hypothetical protein
MVSTEAGGAAQALLARPFAERDAVRSPTACALRTSPMNRPEVSIEHLLSPQRIVISAGGGNQPVWRPDGSELFIVDLEGNLRHVAAGLARVRRQPGRSPP